MLSSAQGATFTDNKLSHHTFFGIWDKIMPEIQVYFIACVKVKLSHNRLEQAQRVLRI